MSKRKKKEETVRTDDPHGVPSPKKKYERLRKPEEGFCLLYPLVGIGLIVLYILC